MQGFNPGVISAGFVLLALSGLAGAEERQDAPRLEFFEKRVRPLLAQNCFNCHSANTNSRGGLRVDDRNGLLTGGGRGPAIVPGNPEGSLLIAAVQRTDQKLKMPPDKPLAEEEIAAVAQWIADGAAWPQEKLPDDLGQYEEEYAQLRQSHWAWQPLTSPVPPLVQNEAWVRGDIDRFILARLEQKSLQPVGDADQVALIRRVTFDLTGLPPTLAEMDAFTADESGEALVKVVDRLLASPAYGERFGRHWLDVARYGESTGSARNLPYPHAWRYRDYVIDAFQADKPYDQFLREQIAGDLLPANSPREKAEQLVATGFLAIGVKDVNQRFTVRYIMDNVDEQIDAVSRAVLGLTASCARCHDHKFDPIPTADYYALAGIFRSTDLCAGLRNKMGGGGLDYYDTSMLVDINPHPADAGELEKKIAAAKQVLETARKEFQAIQGTPEGKEIQPDGKPKEFHHRQRMNKAQAELQALLDPAAHGPVAMGVRDVKSPADTEIRIRGEAEKLGPVVPRGYLSLVNVPDARPINPDQSGRLELAYWLTSKQNPLTPRVMVNRVWQHLFGQGLVKTVDNFGITGDRPSHPELLDYLAGRFMADGWSVKKLVRQIVLSRAYQLSSEATEAQLAVDPANRLVWRHSPRRLEAEEIRDAMLAAAGRLDLARPEASPIKDFQVTELRNNAPEAARILNAAARSPHRSVYLPLLRTLTPGSLAVFDFAEQGMVTGSRDTTTVAPQALYLLNDPFVRRQSLALAESLLSDQELSDSQRVERTYRTILGRLPADGESEQAAAYLVTYADALRASNGALAAGGPAAGAPAGESAAAGTTDDAPTKPAVPAKPNEIDRSKTAADKHINGQGIEASSPETAAWASFCQALFGTAEFRYLK